MEVPHILEADTVNDIYDTIYGKSLSPTMRCNTYYFYVDGRGADRG